jgi:hypothetical protein
VKCPEYLFLFPSLFPPIFPFPFSFIFPLVIIPFFFLLIYLPNPLLYLHEPHPYPLPKPTPAGPARIAGALPSRLRTRPPLPRRRRASLTPPRSFPDWGLTVSHGGGSVRARRASPLPVPAGLLSTTPAGLLRLLVHRARRPWRCACARRLCPCPLASSPPRPLASSPASPPRLSAMEARNSSSAGPVRPQTPSLLCPRLHCARRPHVGPRGQTMESLGRSRRRSGGSYGFQLPPGGTALVTTISGRFSAQSIFIGPFSGIHQKNSSGSEAESRPNEPLACVVPTSRRRELIDQQFYTMRSCQKNILRKHHSV